jgi:large subunit ribosomal protein L2
MGKMLRQQRRGKASPAYTTPSHRFFGDIEYEPVALEGGKKRGQVTGFVDDPARSALLAEILLENGKKIYNVAAEGLCIGDEIEIGAEAKPVVGAIMFLRDVPDSTPVFNLEKGSEDGGKIGRSSGAYAIVVLHDEETGMVNVRLPSKQTILLKPECRATVGVACGGGRPEKPFMKAGAHWYAMKARNKYYPHVRGRAKNAYSHPYGGKTGGKPTTTSRNAPPGRKVGHIGARRTGRRKGKKAMAETS